MVTFHIHAVNYFQTIKRFKSMGGCTNLIKYAKQKDVNGDTIGDWAIQVGKGLFQCKYCGRSKTLSFKQGECELQKHAKTDKHKANKVSYEASYQPTLLDMLNNNEASEVNEKVASLEAAIAMFLARHDIPFSMADCLSELLKKYVTDSEIVSKLQLGSKKASYVINYGLGEAFKKETVQK